MSASIESTASGSFSPDYLQASTDYAQRMASFEGQSIKKFITQDPTLVRSVSFQNFDAKWPFIVRLFGTHLRITIAVFPRTLSGPVRGFHVFGNSELLRSQLTRVSQEAKISSEGRAVMRMVQLLIRCRDLQEMAHANRLAMVGDR